MATLEADLYLKATKQSLRLEYTEDYLKTNLRLNKINLIHSIDNPTKSEDS